MDIHVTTRIARNIDDVWRLLADDFTAVQFWADSVVSAVPLEGIEPVGESPSAGRYCTFTDDPDGFAAREEITHYDKSNHVLRFDFEPVNAPGALPVKANHVEIQLEAVSPNETKLTWKSSPDLKAHGYLLYPMLKMGLSKSFLGLVDDFKAFAEAEASEGKAKPQLAAVS